ncbi:sugar kinase [Saccharothrix obliqua]|uniref:sugar kinase n=1 Tax=Saccharothrix obliqua TaxID=2861747 RepID=UPI001C5F952C|nr:sugar kinase [Saccharothrix obliqua]MBW4721375.1 sugar kinase [Saccharothrix obliqua]
MVDPQVVCVGETMAMFIPHEGRLESAELFLRTAGGAESNVASYLARLDVPVGWMSRVGDDPLGRALVAAVRESGVDVSGVVVDPEHPTGVFFKDIGPAGTRVYYYRRDSAAGGMSPEFADAVLRRAPRLLHLTGITPAISTGCRELVRALLARKPAAGLVSFDVNWRPSLWREPAGDLLRDLARQADVVLVGADEALDLWGTADPAEVRRLLPEPRWLVVKQGADPVTVFSPTGVDVVPGLRVDVREVTGAGDAFAAGFLAGLLRSRDTVRSARLGHLVAASALSVVGDVGELPPISELWELAALHPSVWQRLRVRGGTVVEEVAS